MPSVLWEVEVYNRLLVCQQPSPFSTHSSAYIPPQVAPKVARGPGRPRKAPAIPWSPQTSPEVARGPGRPRKSPVAPWPSSVLTSPRYGSTPTIAQTANSPPKSIDKNNESVQVKVELGHSAVLRDRPTHDGLTHDWTMFIRGPEGSNIQHFVEKVIFHLHDSFPKPKRVVKEPPYSVSESGYGSFLLPIEIYFKTKEEPKKIRFEYDLLLHLEKSSPVNNIRCEKLTFQNPHEDFRRKLLKAGGVGIAGAHDVSSAPATTPSNPKPTPPPPPPPQPPKAHDEIFENLFGAPLKADAPKKLKDKPGPGRPKSSNKTPLVSKGKGPPTEPKEAPLKKEASLSSSQSSVKSLSSSSGSSSKRQKSDSSKRPPERSESVESESKKQRRDKEREKSLSSSKSKSSRHTSKERRSLSSEKREKSRHRHHHESASSSSHKHKSHSSSSSSSKSRSSRSSHRSEKPKEKPSKERDVVAKKPTAAKTIPQPTPPPPPPPITPPPPPPPAPVKPKEPEVPKSPKKDLRPFEEVLSTGEQSDFDPFEESSQLADSQKSSGSKALGKMIEELGNGSSEEHEIEEDMFPASSKVPWSPRASEPKKIMMPHKKMSISDDESSSSSSSSSESEDEDDQPARYIPQKVHHSRMGGKSPPELARQHSSPPPPRFTAEKEILPEGDLIKAPNGETFRTLLELQNKLQCLKERNFLLSVMDIIQETGLYKINENSFDFDLCCLDAGTVHRIKEYMDSVKT